MACRPWARRAPSALLLLTGATWFAGDLWEALLYLHRGPLAHLLLTYRAARRPRGAAAVVVIAALSAAIPALARSAWATLALAVALMLVAAVRRREASGHERRQRGLALAGAAAVGGPLALAAAGTLLDWGTGRAALWAYFGGVAFSGVALAAGVSAARDVIVDLGDGRRRSGLRAALAQALGDPQLSIGFRTATADGSVDEFGRPFALQSVGEGRSVTVVRDGEEAIAALVHEPAALADDEAAASVSAAVRLALANVRLQDEVTAQVRDVAASGRRLVEAGDDERRELAQQVRDGPEPRLLALATRLSALAATRGDAAAADLLELSDQVASAREDVLHFAHGVHPRALTEGDLGAALAQLAATATLDVSVSTPDARFEPAQEAAAFFVCSEALANAAKHSGAGHVTIAVTAGGGRLRVLVDDDGTGGADPALGSGLRGLADRVEALGGTLRVDSPRGGGTRLEAELPIGSAAGR